MPFVTNTEQLMKKILFAALSVTLLGGSARAQRFMGVATGNWNAMNSLYLNPASIAGSNEKLTISLFSVNVGVDNSLGTISSLGSIGNTLNSSDSGAKSVFTSTGGSKFSMMIPSVEVRGPGILFSINSRHTVALTTRIRAFNEFNNFDRSLYNTITQSSNVQNGLQLNTQNFNWTAHLWSEVGLTYGAVIIDNENFQVKGGATLRYLGGVGYLGLKGKNLDLKYTGGSDSLYTSNSDLEFASNIASSQDAFTNGISLGSILGTSLSGKNGSGVGADLGLMFVYKPDNPDDYNNTGNRVGGYKAALSVAVTDLGSITYKNSYNVNVTGNGYITGSGIANNVKDIADFKAYIQAHGYSADTGVKSAKVYMPTAFVISGDCNIWKRVYLSATLISNLASEQNFGSMYYSQLSFTPRYDSKIFSFGMPFTYSMLTNSMRMGMGFRVSGFFFGSDDMLALFSSGQYGFNFYMGAMVPIYKKHKGGNSSNGIKAWR